MNIKTRIGNSPIYYDPQTRAFTLPSERDSHPPILDAAAFWQGASDCRDGKPCPAGMSEDYLRGYGCMYEVEQTQTWRTDHDN